MEYFEKPILVESRYPEQGTAMFFGHSVQLITGIKQKAIRMFNP